MDMVHLLRQRRSEVSADRMVLSMLALHGISRRRELGLSLSLVVDLDRLRAEGVRSGGLFTIDQLFAELTKLIQ